MKLTSVYDFVGAPTVALLFVPWTGSAAPAALANELQEHKPPLVLNVGPSQAGAEGSASDSTPPLPFREALRQAEEAVAMGRPVKVRLASGRYRFRRLHTLTAQASADVPLTIAPADGAQVVFDGGLSVDPKRFVPVTDPVERSWLAAEGADQIVAQTIEDEDLIARLSTDTECALILDGEVLLPARFPNDGYAKLDGRLVAPEVSPPAVPQGREDYGVRAGHAPFEEPGRATGWRGSIDAPRGGWARIGDRADERAGTWAQWQAEIERVHGRVSISGFLDANWLHRSQHIVAADAEREALHLSEALAYGWGWRKNDKPFRITGLLCELDAPGEWHFDPSTRRLFLWPPRALAETKSITVPLAEGFLELRAARHVTLRDVTIEHVAAGTVLRIDGQHNRLAGLTIRRSTALGVHLSGAFNEVLSCDLVDLDRHVTLTGGRRGPELLEAGANRVENCHLYQRDFRHRKVTIGISGVGNVFRNNLVHNSLGQAVTVRGNDHLVERNELFNIGYEEGDGGAIYSGGDLTGYGTVYRHNFIHHLMHVPGKVERSGIHLDDLQAGATCEGNVFYKSAGKGIFMNGGAGHRILNNVFVEGFRGAYNVGAWSHKSHQLQVAIRREDDHDYRGKKEDYVGRAEQVVGPGGWNRKPWKSRYPRFALVMEDAGPFGRLWPIRCEVAGNVYCGNSQASVIQKIRKKSMVLMSIIPVMGKYDIRIKSFFNGLEILLDF